MSRKFRACLIAVVVTLAAASVVFAQIKTESPLPAPTGFVNDYAGVIDAVTKDALEKRLQLLRDGTNPSIEIAVVTVRTTGGQDIFDYSLAVARGWGIGSKADDNPSLLLLVAIDDRKYFTQTSRDAEGDLPDGLVGQIQRQYLVPAFKQGQYGKGIQDTVDAYIRRFAETRSFDPTTLQKTEGQPVAPVGVNTRRGTSNFFACVVCLGILGIFIFILVASNRAAAAGAGGRSSWNGGSFGGAGGRKGGVVESVLPMIIGGIIGSLLSGGRGGSGGSGGWGDGGSSGGGGDWGGFGGGGDFGGGGAGGDW